MSDPVGIVGLGLMGSVLARRLVAASFDVVGYDIDAAKTEALVALGGRAAASIGDVARAANPIILAVFDTDQVEQVVEGPILAALGDGSGRIVMCTSTCDPDRIAALARRVEASRPAVSRDAGVGHQRAGAARRRRRADRRRSGGGGAGRRRARRDLSGAVPRRRPRRRRARQARGEPDPRAQPGRARRRAGVRDPPRPRSAGVLEDRARLRRLFPGDGHQGRENGDVRFRAGRPRPPDARRTST